MTTFGFWAGALRGSSCSGLASRVRGSRSGPWLEVVVIIPTLRASGNGQAACKRLISAGAPNKRGACARAAGSVPHQLWDGRTQSSSSEACMAGTPEPGSIFDCVLFCSVYNYSILFYSVLVYSICIILHSVCVMAQQESTRTSAARKHRFLRGTRRAASWPRAQRSSD